VNVLSPGPIDTGIFDDLPKGAKESFVAMVPRGTIGSPDVVGREHEWVRTSAEGAQVPARYSRMILHVGRLSDQEYAAEPWGGLV